MAFGSGSLQTNPQIRIGITHTGPDSWVGTYPNLNPGLTTSYGSGFGNFNFGQLYFPDGGWVDAAKIIISEVLSSVGYGDYEKGVFDRPVERVPVILYPTVEPGRAEIPDPDDRRWPGDTSGPGWVEDEWIYPEVEPVAHDWGHLLRQGIETFTGMGQPQVFDPIIQTMPIPAPSGGGGGVVIGGGGGTLCPPAGSCGGPRYLTYDCKTGTMSARRRRRRRRLLTDGDKQDLGTIVAMFGKGAAAQIALAAAVKR